MSEDRTRWSAVADGSVRLPVNETMGFQVIDDSRPKESITFTWTVPPEYCNTAGNLQGGILAAFADALLGAAAAAHIPEDRYPALAEMKISIFRPAPEGVELTGRGYLLKSGKRVLFAEAEVTDPDGKLIAKASGTEIPAEG
ncbi:MAG: PaaI family thioesterase [Actinomycetota bacterium]|nr:PaaI family thioesterase [Actinomycetota bacterium]